MGMIKNAEKIVVGVCEGRDNLEAIIVNERTSLKETRSEGMN
jgi:hypothetical protein